MKICGIGGGLSHLSPRCFSPPLPPKAGETDKNFGAGGAYKICLLLFSAFFVIICRVLNGKRSSFSNALIFSGFKQAMRVLLKIRYTVFLRLLNLDVLYVLTRRVE